MADTEEFTNAGHSYTESGFFDERAHYGRTRKPIELSLETLALMALQNLLKLHHREKEGDETITMKEWNNAINYGNQILKKAVTIP